MRELRLMRYDNYIEGGSPGRHEVGHQEGIGGSPGRHYTVLPIKVIRTRCVLHLRFMPHRVSRERDSKRGFGTKRFGDLTLKKGI